MGLAVNKVRNDKATITVSIKAEVLLLISMSNATMAMDKKLFFRTP